MPFVRIETKRELTPQLLRGLGDAVHRALVETLGVPAKDHFQVLLGGLGDAVIYNPDYLDVERTDGIVYVQAYFAAGRTVDQKKAFVADVAARMAELGIRKQDVFVMMVEIPMVNWSFGDGRLQYAEKPPAHLAAAAAS